MEATLEPNAMEQFALNPETANWTEEAVANAWNQFGALVTRVAQLLEIDPAVALAVLAIESGGRAFADDGRMLIRFEPQIFFEEWGKLDPERFAQHFRYDLNKIWEGHQWRPSPNQAWRDFHGKQQAEWEVFTFARNSLAPEAALRSISMGAPQIMGFNHQLIGYPSAQAMFEAFSTSAHAQIIALFDFVKVEADAAQCPTHGRLHGLCQQLQWPRSSAPLCDVDPRWGHHIQPLTCVASQHSKHRDKTSDEPRNKPRTQYGRFSATC